jgi:nicotinamide mononucleotide adenylyltransferase
MKSFRTFITEELESVLPRDPKAKEVSIFLGRMQPLHKAHQYIIEHMKNPLILLVKGKASGTDKEKNPFDEEYQMKLLKKVFPRVEVRVVPIGYVPDAAIQLRKEGIEVVAVHAGSDRLPSYRKQFDGLNSKLEDDQKFHVGYNLTPANVRKMVSATEVRNAIKNDDYEFFKKAMPKELLGEWETMKRKMR